MKKLLYSIIAGGLIFLLPSCSKYTEITPKGANTLSRVSDLELLLNFNFSYNGNIAVTNPAAATTALTAFQPNDLEVLVNDIYPYITSVPGIITSGAKTLNYALTVYDESVDRKTLAATDIKYERLYYIINNVCNAVLHNADAASGDRAKANQLKAEAYIIRAWMHYLLVNFYAKAYNPATAATDGGIPYVKEDNVVAEPNKKSTVAEVYANMLADIDAALKLNSLPNIAVNNMRVGLGFAYGVQAEVLMSMRNYTGALAAANASLAINSTVFDDRVFAPVGSTVFGKPALTSPENLFYVAYSGSPLLLGLSLEAGNYFEPGYVIDSYVKPYYPAGNPFNAVTGSKLWYYTGPIFAINTAGLTTSDTWLIKAECLARAQNYSGAMDALNTVRQRRIHTSVYAPLTANSEAQAMTYIMKTSRVEFFYTMKNFLNIKRWNTEDAYKQTITRTINSVTYTLKPESPLWIFPFPQSGTAYNTNLTQNY